MQSLVVVSHIALHVHVGGPKIVGTVGPTPLEWGCGTG